MTSETLAAPVGEGVARLLEHLIDYAGLFPPAKLPMDEVVANYHGYVNGPNAWMLERLIVPAARLDEFEAAVAGRLPTGEEDDPWALSAIVHPADHAELEADFERIAAFNERYAEPARGLAIVDVVELKAPGAAAIDRALDLVPDELFPFFELPAGEDPRGLIATLVGGEAGAKIRTGGVTADLYPSIADVARFIVTCAQADVPFKATAGLHHPLRHHSDEVGTMEHGFLNVFVAGILAIQQRLDVELITPILSAETLNDFVLRDDIIGFGRDTVNLEQIEDARLAFAISYGSCSFLEPAEDLRGLGLLSG